MFVIRYFRLGSIPFSATTIVVLVIARLFANGPMSLVPVMVVTVHALIIV